MHQFSCFVERQWTKVRCETVMHFKMRAWLLCQKWRSLMKQLYEIDVSVGSYRYWRGPQALALGSGVLGEVDIDLYLILTAWPFGRGPWVPYTSTDDHGVMKTTGVYLNIYWPWCDENTLTYNNSPHLSSSCQESFLICCNIFQFHVVSLRQTVDMSGRLLSRWSDRYNPSHLLPNSNHAHWL